MRKTTESSNKGVRMPLLGDKAPEFEAETSSGKINFPKDYQGKWVILFSHPADFTPVCTSELASFAAMQEDFKKLGVELIGLSVDSVSSHLAWLKNIQDKIRFNGYEGEPIQFPVIADMKMDVAKKYGMIQPAMSDTKAVRAVFVIDPQSRIRTILYYPLSTGRNFAEIKRIVQALQMTDEYGISTPADWRPGGKVLVGTPKNMDELAHEDELMADAECQAWFFCTRNSPDSGMVN